MRNVERVVIITGASHGIGAGLVAGYRSIGYSVVATSRKIDPSNDEHVLTVRGDIQDRATAQKVVAGAKERFGRIDTLVNNAGIFLSKPFVEYTQEEFDNQLKQRNLSLGLSVTSSNRSIVPWRSCHWKNWPPFRLSDSPNVAWVLMRSCALTAGMSYSL